MTAARTEEVCRAHQGETCKQGKKGNDLVVRLHVAMLPVVCILAHGHSNVPPLSNVGQSWTLLQLGAGQTIRCNGSGNGREGKQRNPEARSPSAHAALN